MVDNAISSGFTGDVTLTAGSGGITGGTGTSINDPTGTLTLNSSGGVGTSGQPFNIAVGTLSGDNSAVSNVYVSNTGALVVHNFTNNAGGIIRTHSPLGITGTNSFGAAMTLQAGDSAATGDDLTVGGDITMTNGNTLTLIAGDNILLNSGTIQSTGGTANEIIMTADHEGASYADGVRGGISQTGGTILADNLVLRAYASVNVADTTNNVNKLAGVVSGTGYSFNYYDADNVTIDTVNGQAGISGTDLVEVHATGSIVLNQGITAVGTSATTEDIVLAADNDEAGDLVADKHAVADRDGVLHAVQPLRHLEIQ